MAGGAGGVWEIPRPVNVTDVLAGSWVACPVNGPLVGPRYDRARLVGDVLVPI